MESTDVLFAVDSVPAVFGITLDPFIVFTSNIFAVLGLRAIYFLLAGVMQIFSCFHYGLAAVLAFVGANMIADYFLMPQGAPDRHVGKTVGRRRAAEHGDRRLDDDKTAGEDET